MLMTKGEFLNELRQGLGRIRKAEAQKIMKEVATTLILRRDMPLTDDRGKGECLKCRRRRKLGKRGKGKGICRKCKKG